MTSSRIAPLADGYTDIAPGKVAAVVTHLEMTAPPPPRPVPEVGAVLRREGAMDLGAYRALFREIGQDWLWFGRLALDDAALAATLHDPLLEVHVPVRDGRALGLLELDFRRDAECELAYFGLVPDAVGSGLGRWLMAAAISRAWARPIRKFTVHTCSNDSPQALGFYIRSGFAPVRRQIEVADDPRALGYYPAGAAPHIPRL